MRKSWISLVGMTTGLLAVAALTDACSSGGGGGGGTPTPTPLSITVDSYVTQSGTSAVNPGECIGFTVHEANHQFSPATTMNFTTAAGDPVFTNDFADSQSQSQTTINVLGISSNGTAFTFGTSSDLVGGAYPCVILPFLPAASYGIVVNQQVGNPPVTLTATLPAVIIVGNPQPAALSLGTGFSAAPVAGSLAHANDFAYHPFTAGVGFSVITMDSSGTGNFIEEPNGPTDPAPFKTGGPFLEVIDDQGGVPSFATIAPRGWDVVTAPTTKAVAYDTLVRSEIIGAASQPGYGYQLTLSSSHAMTIAGSDQCVTTTPDFTSAGGAGGKYWFSVDLAGKTADYNPNKNNACFDRHVTLDQPNSGVFGPGRDNTYQVLLTAGQSIRVAAESEGADAVLYLVPTQPTPCAVVTTCKAAADIFGPGDTDSLRYTNTSGTPETLNLIIDDFNATEMSGDYKFNVYVEIK